MLYCREYAVRVKPDLGEDLPCIRSVWSFGQLVSFLLIRDYGFHTALASFT